MSAASRERPRVIALDVAGRVPPHDDDAENAVLSAVLTENRAMVAVRAVLPNGDPFYTDAHRRIYNAAVELHDRGGAVDIQTVASLLRDRDQLQAIGGLAYLARLVDATPAVANVRAHAQIVLEKWRVRTAMETMQMHVAEGYGDYGSAQAYLDRAHADLGVVASEHSGRVAGSLLYDIIKERFASFGSATCVETGFVDVDRDLLLSPGDLCILAARPGMGKTSLALQIARHVASEPQAHVSYGAMVFSLEMPKEQVGDRLLCSEARVDLNRYRRALTGKESLTAGEMDRLVATASELAELRLKVDDTPGITVAEIVAKVREQQATFDRRLPDVVDENGKVTQEGRWLQRVGLVVVDYLQLMKASREHANREGEVSEISRELKAAAKVLQVPVIALSQLNRSVETRGKEKRPQLSDLRESGAIEQDADQVCFIHRPEYYIADKTSPEAAKLKGYASFTIAKQRNGPNKEIPLTFIDIAARFENRARDLYRPEDDQ